mgnify:CR=1 FL=1
MELSYLKEQEQCDLLCSIESEDCTPSLSQAVRLKKLSQAGQLNADKIFAVMSEEKANQKEMFKMPMEDIRKFIPKGNEQKTKDFVVKACEHYHKYLRQRNRDER